MGVMVHEVIGTVQRAPAPAAAPSRSDPEPEQALLDLVERQLARRQWLERRARAD